MYYESLPASCPPETAKSAELVGYLRLVESNPPTEEDFWSHAKKNEPRPTTVDECSWASCSLVTAKKAKTLKKMRRHKHKVTVTVHVKAHHGLWLADSENHVHFWRFAHIDFMELVA